MYAIIETGGKQYKVSANDVVDVELLSAAENETVVFDKVLAVKNGENLVIGDPYIDGVSVKGQVVAHGKGKKVIVFRYKPKKNIRKKNGHRQPFTRVQIEAINV